MKYLRPILFAVVTLTASRASAATSTATFSFPTTTLYSGSAATLAGSPALCSATFSQFNPTLGTLTAISFSYYYHLPISYTGTGGGGGSISGFLETNADRPDADTSISASYSCVATGSTTATASSATPYTPANPISTYTGSGTYTFDWGAGINFTSVGSEKLTSVKIDNTSYVTATYTYTPATVPEPSTWALLGVGAAGVSLAGQRLKASHP